MASPTKKNNTSGKTSSEPVQILPYGQNLLAELASHVIKEQNSNLPDLTTVTVLLPSTQSSTQFRKHLLDEANSAGFPSLLGPEVDTLTNWISRSSVSDLPVLS